MEGERRSDEHDRRRDMLQTVAALVPLRGGIHRSVYF